MSEAPGCSKRSIINIRTNLRLFGDVRAPPNGGGRPRIITPIMLHALCDLLLEKPDRKIGFHIEPEPDFQSLKI